jgi:hypothetical protein
LLSYLQGIDGRSQTWSDFPRHVHASAHVWGQKLLTFQVIYQWGMYLIGCTYNLCWIHHQLGQTPAMAAGLTEYYLILLKLKEEKERRLADAL